MPVTKSAAKAARQNLRHHKRNLIIKRRMKTEIRALISAIAAGEHQTVAEKLKSTQSIIDKAVKHNLIHANKAAHQKSRLSKLVSAKPEKTKATKAAAKKSAPKTAKKPPAAEKSATKSD